MSVRMKLSETLVMYAGESKSEYPYPLHSSNAPQITVLNVINQIR